MQASPHVARWTNMIADQGWDLHLFPVNAMPVLPEFRNITVHQPWITIRRRALQSAVKQLTRRYVFNIKDTTEATSSITERAIYPIPMLARFARVANGFKTSLGISGAQAPLVYGPRVLARLIKELKPDLIHSMEFQHCGYNVLQARKLVGEKGFPKWLATNWGSDIFYYRNDPAHEAQIRQLLSAIDYYSCECQRDIEIARELGMTAEALPVKPNSGGFDLPAIKSLRSLRRPSKRRLIMVKGYQHFAGRALVALDAVAKASDVLKDFKILVFSPSEPIYPRVEELRAYYDLDIQIMSYADHSKMLRLFAAARCYLGVSVSDAISTSMLEALALGAFPIQTNTSCCEEWIEDGKTGFSIPPDDIEFIADRIREAATNDNLVDTAADLNWDLVSKRLDDSVLRRAVIQDYRKLLNL
jgi:glycosyltransferase involved in cell wall biosynthesis